MTERGKKGVGVKRCVRRSVSLSNEYDLKLSKVAVACSMPTASLMNMLIELCLDSPNTVNYLQNKYNKNPQYRVIPIHDGNRVIY